MIKNKNEQTISQNKNNYSSAESIRNLNEENKKPDNESESSNKDDNDNDKKNNDEKDDENEKLIKIIKDISIRINDENNKKKKLENIYEAYNHKDEDKREIKTI